MASLAEIDRDLDHIAVDAAHLQTVRQTTRARLGLSAIDEELRALAEGAPSVPRAAPAPIAKAPTPATAAPAVVAKPAPAAAPVPHSEPADDGPPSGQIDVPDDVLASSELPAVLALSAPPPEPAQALALDLESEAGLAADDVPDLPSVSTNATAAPSSAGPPTESHPLGADFDDPSADLASLLGDSDPMRDEAGAQPLAPEEMEPEPTSMFTAEDAERYSRPAPPMPDDEPESSDVELDLDAEMLEIEEEPAQAAPPRPRTAPPPPPRTAPPPPPTRPSEAPPGKGFLGKLLQRKP